MNDTTDRMDDYLWPVPRLYKYRKFKPPSDKFCEKLSNNYILSYRKDNLKFSRGEWWSTFTKNFSNKKSIPYIICGSYE